MAGGSTKLKYLKCHNKLFNGEIKMTNTLPLWLYIIFKILSMSPVLRVASDKNFGEIKRDSEQVLRLSLISFNAGTKIYSIISWKFSWELKENKGFDLFNIIEFDMVPDESVVNEKVNNFSESLNNKQDSLKALADVLSFRIGQEGNTTSKSFNKFLAYVAIVAFIIPLFSTSMLKIHSVFSQTGLEKWIYIVIIYGLIYCFVNLFLLFSEMIKVKAYVRYTISSVRESENPSKEFLIGQYHDWYWMKEESRVEVSIIKNIEKYIKCILIWSIILVCVYNVYNFMEDNSKEKVVINTQSELVHIDLSVTDRNLFAKNQDIFAKIQEDLLNDRIQSIILIENSEHSTKQDKYNRIKSLITAYNIHNIEIIEISDKHEGESIVNNLQLIMLRR
ncbi:hypothetical protein [Brevibacillus brevis]|uniref:hypothetical protein n=1 Tax=Brevibacillus brevis TaxID=1393 RepID=UPI00165E0C47|nr:hypothetical protein [Brevibacillus brevis]